MISFLSLIMATFDLILTKKNFNKKHVLGFWDNVFCGGLILCVNDM